MDYFNLNFYFRFVLNSLFNIINFTYIYTQDYYLLCILIMYFECATTNIILRI